MKKSVIFALLFALVFTFPASANYESERAESFYVFLIYLIIAAVVCYFASGARVKSAQNENQKLRQQINQLKQNNCIDELMSLRRQITELKNENAILHQSIEPNSEIARLTQQNRELADKVKRLTYQNRELANKIKSLTHQNHSLYNEIADWEQKLKTVKKSSATTIEELFAEKKVLLDENRRLTYQNRCLLDERADWKRKLAEAQASLPSAMRELIAEKEALLDENKRLSSSISGLHKRYFDILGKEKPQKLQSDIMTEDSKDLSPAALSQLALDRYIQREKDLWEVGLDYERLIGYLYEMQGYTVEYVGAVSGVKDMGRDLIVKKDTDAAIIQCKRWAKGKKIHENHILQLYGSTTLYRSQHPEISSVKAIFITTVTLAADAKETAERLDIQVKEKYHYFSHPLVKCYTSDSGKKLYSLPMEKCYDSVPFSLANGDCYMKTVAEAEEAGFISTLETQ